MSLRRVAAWAAIFAIGIGPAPAFSAAKDAVMNKEGYWGIDVDGRACAASMTLQGGSTFLLPRAGLSWPIWATGRVWRRYATGLASTPRWALRRPAG